MAENANANANANALNLNDVINASKIPDPIKFLPVYQGDTKTLHHFLNAVENVIAIYEEVRLGNPAIFNVWLGVIRSKITDKANEALIARNVGNDWAAIRLTLIDFFGDKRDLSTLCQKIPYLKQNKKSVDQFYREVNELSSNINQKIVLDQRYTGHVNAVMIFVNEITKNAFIDGLNNPYNLTVRSFRPNSLEEAKSAAEEQFQSMLRNKMFDQASNSRNDSSRGNSRQTPTQNDLPRGNSRPNTFQSGTRPNFGQKFQAQTQPPPQNQNFSQPRAAPNAFFNQQFNQNRNFNNRQNSQVEPMDAETIRSRHSVQPMSISHRTRNNQVANIEQGEEQENFQEINDDTFDNTPENFDETEDDANFHLAAQNEQTG